MAASRIGSIYEGWRNHFFPSAKERQQILKVGAERMEICNKCIFHSKHKYIHSFWKKLFHALRRDYYCVVCSCTLFAKSKCLSCECPEGKWFAVKIEEI
jgi:hypothetical protein